MDFTTISGLILGIACVWYAMKAGNILELLWNFPSFVLVVGGTIASTLITFPFSIIKNVPRSIMLLFFPPKAMNPRVAINKLIDMAQAAKLNGIDALSERTAREDKFVRLGIKMILQEWTPETIKESMEKEMEYILERHQEVQKAFAAAGGYGPVYGLLGTLIGVLGVLRYLDNPKAMGAAMCLAIVTTFYGIFIANFIALPAAGKLEVYSSRELLYKQLVMMAIVSIRKEDPPDMLRKKLERYVASKLRKADSN